MEFSYGLLVRLYLDACCLNRPFDNQSQARVHLESEAVLVILERVERKKWTLLSSAALEFELTQIPDPQRRIRTLNLISVANEQKAIGPAESSRAKSLQQIYGIRALDALHLACAESLHADAFLTTDDRLLRTLLRARDDSFTFVVRNRLSWLTDILGQE